MFNIKQRREELGLTLEEVGKYVGVAKSTVCKWEQGFIKNMRRDKIEKLSQILMVSPMDFLINKSCFSKLMPQKKVPLTEGQIQIYKDLILSVFNIHQIDNTVVLYKDNSLILLDAQNEDL